MRNALRSTLLLTTLVPLGCHCHGQALSRTEKWRRDIAVLDKEFPKRQIDPWGRVSKAEWEQGIAKLRTLPISDLTDAEVGAEIEHLLARYHDGHIKIFTDGSMSEPKFLPVRFRWFPEGIYITASEDSALRGARLLRLGNTDAEALPARVSPWVSVENDSGLHAALSQALFNTAILSDVGIAPVGKPVAVMLELPSGAHTTVMLEPRPYGEIVWKIPQPLPMYRQDHSPANWMSVLEDRHAVYMHYAECKDVSGNRKLAQELGQALDRDSSLRVVIDLRGNGGGNSAAFAPILDEVRSRHLGDRHQLFAITDRLTFSSAFRNAVELKQSGARIVGEASSQRPIYTGEVKSFLLPESHLQISFTTKWSRLGPPEAMELTPDIPLQPTPKQYLDGEDPVLDKVL